MVLNKNIEPDIQKQHSVFEVINKTFCTPERILLFFVIWSCAAYLPLLYWDITPLRDVADRYAPMAEAFARGDFLYAFHPRCQMLMSTVAGIIALSGCNGFTACKLASFLFYILTAFPLFAVCRRVFGFNIARGAVLLFAFASPLISALAASGLRDSAKMFTQLLIAHAVILVFQERHKLQGYIYAGIASGLAVCVRNDLALVAVTVLFWCGLLDRSAHRWIWRSLIGITVALLTSGLEVGANYYVSGYAIPGARYYYIFLKFFGTEPTWLPVLCYAILPGYLLYIAGIYAVSKVWSYGKGKLIFAAAGGLLALGILYRIIVLAIADPSSALEFLNSIMNGLTWAFFPLAVLGAFFRIRQGEWKLEENWIAILFALFELLLLLQIIIYDGYLYTSVRYLLPAVPLLLPWCWYGAEKVLNFVDSFQFRHTSKIVWVAVPLLIMLSLYCSYREEIKKRTKSKAIREVEALKALTDTIKREKRSYYAPPIDLLRYNPNVKPVIYFDYTCKLTPAAFLGGGSKVSELTPQTDLIAASAHKTASQLKEELKLTCELQKTGEPIPYRKDKIQVWKIIKNEFKVQK